jgi:hypothetical protein
MDEITNNKDGFFKQVFRFDENSKGELMNIVQYIGIAILPVIILYKGLLRYIPDADERKSSVELSFELLLELLLMFIGLFIIHRIVIYVPTYSDIKYPEMSIMYIILSSMFLMISMQSKIGEKVSILTERIWEVWNGKRGAETNSGNANVKISQPISQPMTTMQQAPPTAVPPPTTQQTAVQLHQQMQQPMPMQYESFEPMAANEVLGGMSGTFW